MKGKQESVSQQDASFYRDRYSTLLLIVKFCWNYYKQNYLAKEMVLLLIFFLSKSCILLKIEDLHRSKWQCPSSEEIIIWDDPANTIWIWLSTQK